MPINNCVYYGTAEKDLDTEYKNIRFPFAKGKQISTQLSKNIVVIRTIAVVLYTALMAYDMKTALFRWSAVLLGAAYVGWTLYKHLLSKDPMLEAFYKIVGGQRQFNKLPSIKLSPSGKICEKIRNLKWDHLQAPITRAKTSDGRHILIVKGFSRELDLPAGCQTKAIHVFIERVSLLDIPRRVVNLSELADETLYAVCMIPFGNTFGLRLCSSSLQTIRADGTTVSNESHLCEIHSSLTSSMANELYAQLAEKSR